MKKLPLRAILSTLLILIVLFLAFTGALLYFGKTGVIWGIARGALRGIHFWFAVSMFIAAAAHLVLNCRLYLASLRELMKRKGRNK